MDSGLGGEAKTDPSSDREAEKVKWRLGTNSWVRVRWTEEGDRGKVIQLKSKGQAIYQKGGR